MEGNYLLRARGAGCLKLDGEKENLGKSLRIAKDQFEFPGADGFDSCSVEIRRERFDNRNLSHIPMRIADGEKHSPGITSLPVG